MKDPKVTQRRKTKWSVKMNFVDPLKLHISYLYEPLQGVFVF